MPYTPTEEAVAKIWMVDSKGFLVKVHLKYLSLFEYVFVKCHIKVKVI